MVAKKSPEKDCYLYTLDGVLEATAGEPFLDYGNRKVVKISAKDSKLSIDVPAGVSNDKFHNEEKPTFYAC